MKRIPRIGMALLAATIAACASSPPTLVALPVPSPGEGHQKAAPASAATILLRPVVLPGYLENYPVVVARSGNTLVVSNDTEWAEPLRDAVARALRAALSQRLGPSRVLIDGDGRIPDADLSVEFLALDPQRGALRLDAKWAFSCTARKSRGRADRTFLEIPLGDASPAGIATATAEALGRFADVLAAQAPCLAEPLGATPLPAQRSDSDVVEQALDPRRIGDGDGWHFSRMPAVGTRRGADRDGNACDLRSASGAIASVALRRIRA